MAPAAVRSCRVNVAAPPEDGMLTATRTTATTAAAPTNAAPIQTCFLDIASTLSAVDSRLHRSDSCTVHRIAWILSDIGLCRIRWEHVRAPGPNDLPLVGTEPCPGRSGYLIVREHSIPSPGTWRLLRADHLLGLLSRAWPILSVRLCATMRSTAQVAGDPPVGVRAFRPSDPNAFRRGQPPTALGSSTVVSVLHRAAHASLNSTWMPTANPIDATRRRVLAKVSHRQGSLGRNARTAIAVLARRQDRPGRRPR